jgi:hypothetical protein
MQPVIVERGMSPGRPDERLGLAGESPYVGKVMADPLPKRRGRFPVALAASLAVHAALVLPFLISLPDAPAKVKPEESVAVEIVPEPDKTKPPEEAREPAAPPAEAKAEPPAAPPPTAPPPPAPPPPAAPPPAEPPKPASATKEQAAEGPPGEQSPSPRSLPFEASAAEAPDTVPDPDAIEMPKPAETGAEAQAADVEAKLPEPVPASPPATPDAAKPSAPEILAAANARVAGADAADVPAAPAELEPGPAPAPAPPAEDDAPMTPPEQAAYVPERPAVPSRKPSSTPEPDPAPLTKVKAIYAKDILADPRVRGALSKLPPSQRIVQMCIIEAGEQVRHSGSGLTPDLLKGFGRGGGLITGTQMSASGGAVRSRGTWYDIRFDCTVNDAFDTITAFRFSLGERVPRTDWARRNLIAD